MQKETVVGAAFVLSNPIINTAASAVGVAKTGTAIGTLHGAAHASATAAWVGLGSMKAGLFVMNALPVVGALLLLDSLSGRDPGSPIIDWYEQAWRDYEVQCELEELKQQITVDPNHQVRSKTRASSLAQLDNQFRSLEVEHELYQLKQELGLLPQRLSQSSAAEKSLQQAGQASLTPEVAQRENITHINPGSLDCGRLRQLLEQGKLQEADLETTQLLLQLAQRQQEGWLRSEDIKGLPPQALLAIDRVWSEASNGRFGFSAQKQIWRQLSCDSSPSLGVRTINEERFGRAVGWYGTSWTSRWEK
ncbi:GUN4 domain-containing protein [Leptolyngbya ohadii]|uniref:GUN4 domain-containing protein n=1 Tax=Leptolyngbya ohadii TaxID=1962290 RepID=UPI000B59AC1D|nr:GUN4 domain-containing protein [Leptolyngbya ohadii]